VLGRFLLPLSLCLRSAHPSEVLVGTNARTKSAPKKSGRLGEEVQEGGPSLSLSPSPSLSLFRSEGGTFAGVLSLALVRPGDGFTDR